jgi:hypothetical protein
MSNQDALRVVTGKVRLSYVHLFSPFAKEQGKEPKFSATLLIPKSDFATRQRLDAAINAAIQEGTSKVWNGVRPPQIHLPIHDGDGVKPSDGMPFGEECKGHWVMTASSKANMKPDIVDINLNPIINQSEIYSGVYARVSVRFFAYNASGKKGIGCGLGNVQKLEDGEPLSGGRSAASDFGGAPGYQPPTPQYGQAPQPSYTPTAPQHPYPTQPQYGQQPQPGYAPQGQPQPQQPVQYDPITGKPLNGGIMGL